MATWALIRLRAHIHAIAVLTLASIPTAQADVSTKRVSDYDWQCVRTNGTTSNHDTPLKAAAVCFDDPTGEFIQGGRYRIIRRAESGAGTVDAPISPAPSPSGAVSSHANAAMLTWNAPTLNTDGSVLADLAGYRVLYGTVSPPTIAIDLPGANTTRYEVTNLPPGVWFFQVVARNASGALSAPSAIVSKVIQ